MTEFMNLKKGEREAYTVEAQLSGPHLSIFLVNRTKEMTALLLE